MTAAKPKPCEECERLRDALKFYANGDWCDGYPGGVRVEGEGWTVALDFGDTARAALERAAGKGVGSE